MRTGSYELFDLSSDLGESKNLILNKEYEKIAKELKSELNTILQQNKTPIPKIK